MKKVAIHCPRCGRVMGDTDHEFDAITINCRGCRKASKVGMRFAKTDELLSKIYKENDNGNKSK